MAPLELLDKKVAEEPIKLPEHPYWIALKNIGGDELLAGGIDALSTTLINYLVSEGWRKAILPLAGPVLEKAAFFPMHLKEAWDVYRTMPQAKRQPFSTYAKKAFADGSSNLIKDICIHDPIYVGLMVLGLNYTPDIHPGFLSAMSYGLGILGVAAVDVSKDETLHWYRKKQLKKVGFKSEEYYESRFFLSADKNQEDVLTAMMQEFNLTGAQRINYSDRYFGHKIPQYSGRTAKLRLRHRQRKRTEEDNCIWGEDPEWVNSVQIVFTRAREQKNEVDQCRYFPLRKEKLYYLLPETMPQSIEDIVDGNLRRVLSKLVDKKQIVQDISFERLVARNEELAVCTDRVEHSRPFYLVELKAYQDQKLLQQAMRYLMVECPVVAVQTTHGKKELLTK